MPVEAKAGNIGGQFDVETAERIFAAVGLPVVVLEPVRERLAIELVGHLAAFGELPAGVLPVTKAEAEAIEKALEHLRRLVDALQDRANPPPQLVAYPTSRNGRSTSIDYWLTPYRFPAIAGRPKSHDWPWISRLLAFYEIAFGKTAKASPAGVNQRKPHPTIRFLDAALAEVRCTSGKPPVKSFSPDTLRAYLGRGGRAKVTREKRDLQQLLGLINH